MAKFIAIDANGLNALFSGSEIFFVKPNCKKKNSPKQLAKLADYSQGDQLALQVTLLDIACTSQFQFRVWSWETNISQPIAVNNQHYTSNLSYRYLDNAYPPPRLA
ncbi:hypothetical protein D9O36_06690 [Zobellia amurskyensis]|uniref:Uncharacterized protein n=2 Tax=Zobellia amurskyensis TaxID=248905 RepID=A0A7X2ZSH2_9FLAO|nr:hypothetical protein [Zobellia amurskyensis]